MIYVGSILILHGHKYKIESTCSNTNIPLVSELLYIYEASNLLHIIWHSTLLCSVFITRVQSVPVNQPTRSHNFML
jgi:hypothetical protein